VINVKTTRLGFGAQVELPLSDKLLIGCLKIWVMGFSSVFVTKKMCQLKNLTLYLISGVNFANILRTYFLYETDFAAFL
jgi:hypothetical protein